MKKLFILAVPILLATTLLLATSLANVNTFGQMGNQTSSQGNQTGGNLNVKLFGMTGQAIAALKDDNSTGAEDLLGQMQQNLAQATGKQIVVVPSSDSGSDDSGSGSSGSDDSGSSGSGSSGSGSADEDESD